MSLTERLSDLGARPEDTQRERQQRSAAVLIAAVTVPFGVLWSALYAYLGLPASAAIPLLYGVISVVGLVVLSQVMLIGVFRPTQMAMYLTFPFLLQWSLGGFANSSAVAIWAMGAPLLAHVVGARARPWLVGFVVLAVFSGLIDSRLAASAPEISSSVITTFFVLNFLGIAFVIFVALRSFIAEEERAKRALKAEQEKSERLLLKVLPGHIAERLKLGEEPIVDRLDQVTVLVADIVGFTPMSEHVAAADVVDVLNRLFSRFDDLTGELGLEKLKTIGDSYQAVGGLPGSNPDQVAAPADLALAMQDVVGSHAFPGFDGIQVRIGINAGPVVAGVIGKHKFSYDLWGDTINTASRMESHGVPGRIQVTEAVHQVLRDRYEFEPRGTVEIKGKGELATYFLRGPRARQVPSSDSTSRASSSASNAQPNAPRLVAAGAHQPWVSCGKWLLIAAATASRSLARMAAASSLGHVEHSSTDRGVDVAEGGQLIAGHDQEVPWSDQVDIHEGDDRIVLVDESGLGSAADDGANTQYGSSMRSVTFQPYYEVSSVAVPRMMRARLARSRSILVG